MSEAKASETDFERWIGDLSKIKLAFKRYIRLQITRQEATLTKGKVSISRKDWVRSDFVICLGKNHQEVGKFVEDCSKNLSNFGIKAEHAQFTIYVTNPLTRDYEELLSCQLNEIPKHLDHESSSAQLHLPKSKLMQSFDTGFDLGVVLYINREQIRQPLTPWRKATWLEQSIFNVRGTEKSTATKLDYIPLTNEIREQFKLHNLVSHYVDVTESPLIADSSDEDLDFYIDQKIIDEFKEHQTKKVSGERFRYEQETLLVEARLAQIMRAHHEYSGQTLSDLEGSIILKIIDEISYHKSDKDNERSQRMKYFEFLQNDPYKLYVDYVNVAVLKKKQRLNTINRLKEDRQEN